MEVQHNKSISRSLATRQKVLYSLNKVNIVSSNLFPWHYRIEVSSYLVGASDLPSPCICLVLFTVGLESDEYK